MTSPQHVRVWPILDQYDNALKDTAKTVSDPDIKIAKLSHDSRPLRMNVPSGRYSAVYKVTGITDWVVKCFITTPLTGKLIEPPPDIDKRYQEINSYLHSHITQLSFLVPHILVEKGININGDDWPFIKSAFIHPSQALGQFLEDRHADRAVVTAFSKQWLTMMNSLEVLNIAHGDLDATNVLVCGSYPQVKLRLVDFDCMYAPALQGRMLYEQGHEHFQPIQQGVRKFNNEMDRFSALIIYLSLIALADDPELWQQCKAREDTKMLLGADDFSDLRNSTSYNLLLAMRHNQSLQKCLHELERSMREIRMPKSLSDILNSDDIPFLSYYEAPPIPIPIAPFSQGPLPQAPPPPSMPDIVIPIPTEFLPQAAQPQSQKTQQPRKTHQAVWLLLAATIITIIIAIILSSQESNSSLLWLIGIVLFFLTLIVWRNTSR